MPALPELSWKAASPELRAAVLALVQAYEKRLALLENRLGDLENRFKLELHQLVQTSLIRPDRNEAGPSAPPHGKEVWRPAGHRKARRSLVPPEKIRDTFDCKSAAGSRCCHRPAGDNPEPMIPQSAKLHRIEPIVDVYRLHRLICPACRRQPAASRPPASRVVFRPVPSGRAGYEAGIITTSINFAPCLHARPVPAQFISISRHFQRKSPKFSRMT